LITGRSPLAIVGAIIYIASIITHEKRTQAEIASAANVTEVTIRNRYKELKDILEIDRYNYTGEYSKVGMDINN
jgi:transcription initiation factor TFIIB